MVLVWQGGQQALLTLGGSVLGVPPLCPPELLLLFLHLHRPCCLHRLCTWLSFDGGFSWTDIAEGTWIYEYADWGGLVVMSKHELSGPATEVRLQQQQQQEQLWL
jgi:hypothetical protein